MFHNLDEKGQIAKKREKESLVKADIDKEKLELHFVFEARSLGGVDQPWKLKNSNFLSCKCTGSWELLWPAKERLNIVFLNDRTVLYCAVLLFLCLFWPLFELDQKKVVTLNYEGSFWQCVTILCSLACSPQEYLRLSSV